METHDPRPQRDRGSKSSWDGLTCEPGFVSAAVAQTRETVIYLGPPLPAVSSGLPDALGEQPSSSICLTLLRVGFT